MTYSHPKTYRLIALVTAMGLPLSAPALNTVTITTSSLSPDCLAYRVVGICYWLYCTNFGCQVKTSPKVRHYVPDAVVSSWRFEWGFEKVFQNASNKKGPTFR